jgi:RNA polymerase sigma-70 factor (ECF subfamily)
VLGADFDHVIEAARNGSRSALAALYEDLQPAVLAYLRARHRAEAEDLASEVWVSVAAGLVRFRGDESGFRGWVFTIARRRLVDELRRRGRRRGEWLVGAPAEAPVEAARRAPDPAERLDDLGAALALVRLLPADQADAVLLRVVVDLDVTAVAAVMGRSEGSVRVLTHRGLRRLQELLAEQGVTPADPSTMYREQ